MSTDARLKDAGRLTHPLCTMEDLAGENAAEVMDLQAQIPWWLARKAEVSLVLRLKKRKRLAQLGLANNLSQTTSPRSSTLILVNHTHQGSIQHLNSTYSIQRTRNSRTLPLPSSKMRGKSFYAKIPASSRRCSTEYLHTGADLATKLHRTWLYQKPRKLPKLTTKQ